MKILYLTTHLNTGGITAYLLTLAKGLIKKGHEVHIASTDGDMAEAFRSVGVNVFNIDIKTKSDLSPKIYFNLKKVADYLHNNDIDIVHSNTRVTQVMGALLHNITGRTHISTCHGYFKTRLTRRVFPCWGSPVIAISEAVAKHLVDDFSVPAERVRFVLSGIELEKFRKKDPKESDKKRALLNLGDNILVGMVARLSDVKGQDILIQAMSLVVKVCPQVKLILFGDGKIENTLKEMAGDLDLADSVIFKPSTKSPVDCMHLMDIYVAPSRQEGLGLSIMEAQTCGLPVIGSNVGGIPSLIENNKTGILVEPEDVSALSEAIIRLTIDRDLSLKIGEQAREYALSNYSSDIMIEKMENIYCETRESLGKA